MNLIIDIGNTSVKTALFNGNKISQAKVHSAFTFNTLKAISTKGIENVILCTVKDYPVEWKNYLQKNFNFIELNEKTPVPIKNDYRDKATLGKDRLASAVAANNIYPGKNVLAINAGTCITCDFVDKNGVYKGGSISPGLEMRFKAMHTFTGRLPLLKPDTKFKGLVGKTTKESMLAGAQQGMLKEIEGIIAAYTSKYPNLQIIMSGGSLLWLKASLSMKINSQPFLTLKGLNVILASCLSKK
ncbi:MAG TPA: type III pantothenate kinase [Bacteroidia bacterium]|jgi:type III pantothenate kinase|nr:type III pantothenate kinase [Bacteroidia bacterium]